MAIFAIGDIHGCLKALETIFSLNVIKSGDTVVFLGDYVDRGPDSKGVIDWLLANKKNFHFEFILGNHEIMMMDARVTSGALSDWLFFGGAATLDSYGIGDDPDWARKIDPAHWHFIENCKPYFETEDYIFVHAGLSAGTDLHEQNKYHLFWEKYETPSQYSDARKVICGHTSRKNGEIADFGHTVCIDTYAYGGMWLTCLNADTNEFIQANDKGEYKFGELQTSAVKNSPKRTLSLTPDSILELLPLACRWVEEQEAFILENGVALDEDQQIDAYLARVKDPQKVRLLKVDVIPFPTAPALKKALDEIGLLTSGSLGLSLRYGIFIQSGRWNDRRIVIHELVHTMQYERLGGIHNFLRQYVDECIAFGYLNSPLETEAREMEKKLTQR